MQARARLLARMWVCNRKAIACSAFRARALKRSCTRVKIRVEEARALLEQSSEQALASGGVLLPAVVNVATRRF